MQKIKISARESSLSKAQVEEVLTLLKNFHPLVEFEKHFLQSLGDKDLKTSLTLMEKSDFFTKEIDELVLSEVCDVSIHSAKDLQDPLDERLEIFAITEGQDPSDVHLLPKEKKLESLRFNAKIGTSSLRREKAIKKIRKDFIAQDIRGTIEERIRQLNENLFDGIIVAKAALIRLGLLDLNWIQLDQEVASMQGRLAIVGRKNDVQIRKIFRPLHVEQEEYEKSSLFRFKML